MTLFFILLGLAVYLALAMRSAADDPWRDVGVAGYVAIGCSISATLALVLGVLLLHRRRRR
jgi:hypothetical protein